MSHVFNGGDTFSGDIISLKYGRRLPFINFLERQSPVAIYI